MASWRILFLMLFGQWVGDRVDSSFAKGCLILVSAMRAKYTVIYLEM